MQLNYAESRLTQLEGCHCERTCSANGLVYRDKELWVEPENCRNCACKVSVTFILKNHRITDFSIKSSALIHFLSVKYHFLHPSEKNHQCKGIL